MLSVPSRPLTWVTALAFLVLSFVPGLPSAPLAPGVLPAAATTGNGGTTAKQKPSGTKKSGASTSGKTTAKKSSAKSSTTKKSTTAKKTSGGAKSTKKSTTGKSAGSAKTSTSGKKSTSAKKSSTGVTSSTTKKSTTAKAKAKGGTKKRTTARSKAAAPVVFDPAKPNTLRAPAAVVLDRRTGGIVWAKNEDEPRPIASLTKLMTALVFLDANVSLVDSMTVTSEDIAGAGRSHVRAGNRVPVGDLLRCSLISSDNAATRTLARSTGLSIPEFTKRMNQKAFELGLHSTHYAEVTGLDPANVSTALDQAKILDIVWADPVLAGIMQTETYSFRCSKRVETLTNTNRLLRTRSDIAGGKTGFIRPAGYCLATHAGDRSDPHLTTVVLGAASNSSRFAESAKLIDWALKRTTPSDPNAKASHRR